jgi:hypothetical protein
MKLLPKSFPHDGEDSYVVSHSKLRLEEEVEQFRVMQKAQAKLKKAGLPKPTQYRDDEDEPLDPKLRADLPSISNAELGVLMGQFVAMCEYAAYAAAVADVNRTTALSILNFVEAKVRLSKSGTVRQRADKTEVDPRVVAARTEFLERDAVATLTAALQKNYERGYTALSREISRRQVEAEIS